ncbi:MAG TPA: hypothetical protein VMF61_08455 [Candidatus Acidoferrales bacterium]|nr:hypothetical protein [Candidatus Acidoferrales bacterium]
MQPRLPRRLALLIAGLFAGVPYASSAASIPPPVRGPAARLARLPQSRPAFRSWIAPGLAHSSAPLIYASVITSVSSGQTNIYEESSSGSPTLTLVGELNEGGGPVAVDSQQNVYVAESGKNVLGFSQRNIYVYARGSTTPMRVLKNPRTMTWALAVTKDGTVYAAGYDVPASAHPSHVKAFRPGSTTGKLLPNDAAVAPASIGGIAIDPQGDLAVGWQPYSSSPATCNASGPLLGCLTTYSPGSKTWTTQLQAGSAISGYSGAGPAFDAKGRAVVSVFSNGVTPVEYLLAYPPGSSIPSHATSLSFANLPVFGLTFGDGGSALWVYGTLFNAPSEIWKLAYPNGNVELAYPVPQNSIDLLAPNGVAVSPPFAP